MANMFDYLDWYGDFGFDVVPFNEVDNLIFSELAYLDLDGIVPAAPGAEGGGQDGSTAASLPTVSVEEASQRFSQRYLAEHDDPAELMGQEAEGLLRRMAAGRRFRDARLGGYEARLDLDTHEQFAALCALLPDGSTYVAYRGTNGELVGWLEDCEMSYKVVPSQEHALRYLRRIGEATEGPLRVGGHSKGGNLAAYAVSRVGQDVRSRVVEVWCNDSPGFDDRVVPLASLEPIAALVHLFTPEYSVVGALFSHVVEPTVVKSSGTGVMAHKAIYWQVMRGEIVRGTSTQNGSARVRETFAQLMDARDLAGRQKLLDSLYQALCDQGITSVQDMFSRGLAGINATLASVNSLDEEDRQTMTAFLGGIVSSTVTGAVVDAVTPVAGAVAEAVTPVAKQLGNGLRDVVSDALDALRAAQAGKQASAGRQRDSSADGGDTADDASGQDRPEA